MFVLGELVIFLAYKHVMTACVKCMEIKLGNINHWNNTLNSKY